MCTLEEITGSSWSGRTVSRWRGTTKLMVQLNREKFSTTWTTVRNLRSTVSLPIEIFLASCQEVLAKQFLVNVSLTTFAFSLSKLLQFIRQRCSGYINHLTGTPQTIATISQHAQLGHRRIWNWLTCFWFSNWKSFHSLKEASDWSLFKFGSFDFSIKYFTFCIILFGLLFTQHTL